MTERGYDAVLWADARLGFRARAASMMCSLSCRAVERRPGRAITSSGAHRARRGSCRWEAEPRDADVLMETWRPSRCPTGSAPAWRPSRRTDCAVAAARGERKIGRRHQDSRPRPADGCSRASALVRRCSSTIVVGERLQAARATLDGLGRPE